MLRYADIIRRVNAILKDKYPDIRRYGRDTVDKAITPYFFVSCVPLVSEHESRNLNRKACIIRITYVQRVADQADNLDKLDALYDAFGLTLSIPEADSPTVTRKLHVYEYACDYVGEDDNILQISFTLRWYDSTQGEYDGTGDGVELMKNVNVNYTED